MFILNHIAFERLHLHGYLSYICCKSRPYMWIFSEKIHDSLDLGTVYLYYMLQTDKH